jgi:hypothetical protein
LELRESNWQRERQCLLQATAQLRDEIERFAYSLLEAPPCGLVEIAEPAPPPLRAA